MSRLSTPLTLPCGLVLPDRLAMAPLTNLQSNADGTLSDVEHRWLLRRATAGFRVLSTCATYVDEEGHAWPGQLGIDRDAHLEGLTRLAADLTAAGAVTVIQLHHGGKQATLAPGLKLSTADDDAAGIHGATEADIERVIGDFVAAARRAQAAGFQGVEIHGANGYLFLFDPHGLRLADSVQLGRWLADDGVDFVHLSLRDAVGPAPLELDSPVVARAFRDALPPKVALFVVGGVWTRADADVALDAGADVVVVGKAAIGNADLREGFEHADCKPQRPPWTRAHLASQDLGETFIDYVSKFPGMVVGGAAPRG